MTGIGVSYEVFPVQAAARMPLLGFMLRALEHSGCVILNHSEANRAPFRISFVTPWGERMGVLAYAFLANSRVTANRPSDEHRFQLKYGSKDGRMHDLWQDPFGLYTTLLIGINTDQEFFVGADPVLNSPTRLFISKEFKQAHVNKIRREGWYAWEREQKLKRSSEPEQTEQIEVLVGGTARNFLKYVLFEREARGESQGYRHMIADEFAAGRIASRPTQSSVEVVPAARLHQLEREFHLSARDVLEMIGRAPRLKMAVRGWVAERHLHDVLNHLRIVRSVEAIERDGEPDFRVFLKGGRRPVLLECKNVLRTTDKHGRPKLDFQKTRAAKNDPCSRYYRARDFDVVVACLHAQTERWEFAARRTRDMAPSDKCPGRLDHRIVIDNLWTRDLKSVLVEAAA